MPRKTPDGRSSANRFAVAVKPELARRPAFPNHYHYCVRGRHGLPRPAPYKQQLPRLHNRSGWVVSYNSPQLDRQVVDASIRRRPSTRRLPVVVG